ncbi:MAG: RNA polymerase factor sigma-54 [Rhodobacteraceae bacterium]|nr:RNA polymerase factor sigma-54 [Paracoccaceae bacterium]
MAMKPGLSLQQSQRLALTPELRLSIRVLAMSAGELNEVIKAELAENPLLDWQENHNTQTGQAYDYALDTVAENHSAAELLRRQIALMKAPPKTRQIAEYLASDLTEAGFLAESAWSIARTLGLEVELVEQAIELLQQCEPAGIGARDLRDCLDLQLKARGVSAEARKLLLQNLTKFAESDWPFLTRHSNLPVAELKRLQGILQSLNPYPMELLSTDRNAIVAPDITVEPLSGGGFAIELVDSPVQALVVNTGLVNSARNSNAAAATYLKQNLTRANSLIRAIEARSKTVLRITHEIVARQHGFFTNDKAGLKPMTQREVATALGLHPSTVTRAIAHKTLSCPQGIFALKFFFSAAIQTLDGDPAVSAYVVQQQIRRMINAESDASILSDAEIVSSLRQSGVDIARRTVAKYRQCLNIPSSIQRRRSKGFL